MEIVRILENHIKRYGGPTYLLLENVRNIISHDHGQTWKTIRERIENIGYNIIKTPVIASPHYFGIPQLRERAIIVAVRKDIYDKEIKLEIKRQVKNTYSMDSILLDDNHKEYDLNNFLITPYENKVLDLWDEFIKGIKDQVIGYPIWSDWFFDQSDYSEFPNWKQEIIKKNKQLYNQNKEFIDSWYNKNDCLKTIKKTHRKFEWQAGETINSLYEGIIQFRTSGVRVKRATEFPVLVAMVHVPIVGKYKRYLTPREVGNLQSFPSSFKICEDIHLAYKQFGNAVNVDVIYNVFKKFVESIEKQE